MDVTELQWITYLSLIALAIVTYLYIRQRNENNQRAQSLRSQDEYFSAVTKPTGFMSKSYPGPGPNLPTFSPQEAFQRKNPGEMNASQKNQRDLRDRPAFGGGNVSHFNIPATDKSTDKSFDEYRRYTPYEPSQEISTSRASFKQDQNDRNKPHWSKIETSITQISTQQDPYDANRDILYAQTQPQVSQVEEEQPTGEKWNNTKTLDAPELENEYKVFRDFKLREGRGFHDEPKRDESPIRANSKKLSGLDRVGHSPDSPFKMFGSPAIGTNSKKKTSTNQVTRQHQNLFSKKDSFTRTQEALNQKNKPQVRTVPHNQRSAKVLADQRNERKAKLNQVFIDNNSEDEMHVEHEKDPAMKNKRPAADTRSFDRFEKETNNKKVLKTNDQQAKAKPFERKNVPLRGNYQLEGHSKKEQKPSFNTQSSVDLSYMSEYSANPSLKKYVQMKTRQDETTRVSKPSTPITNTKGMNVEKSPRQATSPRVEKGSYRAPSSLARKEDTPAASKKLTSNGSHGGLKSEGKQDKTVGTTQPKSDNDDHKGLFGNNNGNKLTSLPKEVNVKAEGAKISSIIGGSSLFTQPKTEAAPNLGEEEKKTSKSNEIEKAPQQPSMGQGNAFNLFKTIRPGGFGASKESEDQPSSKKNEEEPQKQASLFSNPKSDQKQDNEKPQDQPKTELKGLFPSSGGGLFGNLNSATQNKAPESSSSTGLFGNKETKETEQKQPSSAFSSLTATAKSNEKEDEKPKTGLFGSLTTPASGGLFGNLTSEPKKDLNQSSVPSLFGNANKDTQKKDDPLLAYSKQPDAAEDKSQGLFAGSNTSFGGLFKNAGESSGGGSLFGGLANKDGKSAGGGLFSNLNK